MGGAFSVDGLQQKIHASVSQRPDRLGHGGKPGNRIFSNGQTVHANYRYILRNPLSRSWSARMAPMAMTSDMANKAEKE